MGHFAVMQKMSLCCHAKKVTLMSCKKGHFAVMQKSHFVVMPKRSLCCHARRATFTLMSHQKDHFVVIPKGYFAVIQHEWMFYSAVLIFYPMHRTILGFISSCTKA